MHPPIPILMYHMVAPQPPKVFRKYSVTSKMFAAQMRWLAVMGYETISLDQLFAARCGRGVLPARPVILTFDDGLQACVDYAVPILQAHNFSAIFFLVAGAMGQTSTWTQAECGLTFSVMDWATARALTAAGFQCGAHSMTHRHLSDLSRQACQTELAATRSCLEDQLGHEIRHMAYPYGSFNPYVQSLLAETGYQSACSVVMGLSSAEDDLLALRRVPIDGHDSFLDFVCRLKTAWTIGEILHRKTYGAWCRMRDRREQEKQQGQQKQQNQTEVI